MGFYGLGRRVNGLDDFGLDPAIWGRAKVEQQFAAGARSLDERDSPLAFGLYSRQPIRLPTGPAKFPILGVRRGTAAEKVVAALVAAKRQPPSAVGRDEIRAGVELAIRSPLIGAVDDGLAKGPEPLVVIAANGELDIDRRGDSMVYRRKHQVARLRTRIRRVAGVVDVVVERVQGVGQEAGVRVGQRFKLRACGAAH